ncbi:MAG: ATP-binding cassette domain-containing protein [Saprospiraceae bacterium]|nr:ATP-binding cassette domain-containing protein [Saprospiraceae bacterium]
MADSLQDKKEEKVIVIKELYKSFGKNDVLKNFNLEVFKNEALVVLGKSGSGKSVLIKCIIGLLRPDSGSIKVFGEEVTSMEHVVLDRLRMRIGFLFQSNALYDSMTVRENLEFPLRRHGVEYTKAEVNIAVEEVLQNVGLPHTQKMLPSELSGGMKKRIALARTLILKPEIILYDEPTTGLDPITAREISDLMVEVQEKYSSSSIVISHDINCVKVVANRIALLVDGKCYMTGTFDELQNSQDLKVKPFFI